MARKVKNNKNKKVKELRGRQVKIMEIEAFNKKTKIQYIEEGKNLIALEDSLIKAAYTLGCHSLEIKEIKIVNDILYAYGKPIWIDYDKNMCVEEDREQKNGDILRGNRYIVIHELTTPDDHKVSALGSAAIDNVTSDFRTYCPEVAERRARCRNILVAVGKKDLNADIEMPVEFWGPEIDKKEEERQNNGLASPTQISALNQIYNAKTKREKLFQKLNKNGKYKKKITDFKQIKEKDARKAITEAQQTNELIK